MPRGFSVGPYLSQASPLDLDSTWTAWPGWKVPTSCWKKGKVGMEWTDAGGTRPNQKVLSPKIKTENHSMHAPKKMVRIIACTLPQKMVQTEMGAWRKQMVSGNKKVNKLRDQNVAWPFLLTAMTAMTASWQDFRGPQACPADIALSTFEPASFCVNGAFEHLWTGQPTSAIRS